MSDLTILPVDETPPILQVKGLAKQFTLPGGQRVEVLRGVDFTLKRGEMAALLGVSGSGKSTLLQIVGSLDRPTNGQVLLDGQEIFAQSEKERAALRNRRIGFVYQFHRLLPEFSALENVMMPLLIRRESMGQAREKAVTALNEVGLSHRLEHRPSRLSGGEQQRVAIARALVGRPALLLADEPTGNLDRHTAQEVFALLRDLNRRLGLSGLLVTHNAELADSLDKRLHLVDGRLVH
ncbi:MAG: ABC transporter ATP-binding protein [Magnetococcales bacterium]|nr:ABC transporter ATP-binding protein [Magnetococcales bacterium]